MAALGADIPLAWATDKPSHAVRILRVYSVVLMVFPSNYNLKVIGADGYAAALVSYLAIRIERPRASA